LTALRKLLIINCIFNKFLFFLRAHSSLLVEELPALADDLAYFRQVFGVCFGRVTGKSLSYQAYYLQESGKSGVASKVAGFSYPISAENV
jgi:hypothetical protein